MLAIYADPSHYAPTYRGELADVLRPLWKEPPLSPVQRREHYGPHVDRLVLTEQGNAADLWVLPMSWNFYIRTRQLDLALAYVARARELGKPVVSWVTGDHGVTVPVEDVYVFRASGYASKRRALQHATPVIIGDPLNELGLERITTRQKGPVPVVGFCGQAADPLWKRPLKLGAIAYRNLGYHVGVRSEEPQVLRNPTQIRARALRLLERSPLVHARFVVRSTYRAQGEGIDPGTARQAFLENVISTDYTLCLRGGGNFSKRLYETLALGRIPILINTDCILPWDTLIDWKDYVVWIEERELGQIGKAVADFHRSLTPDEFVQRQFEVRTLWEERLSYSGFFGTWVDFFQRIVEMKRAEVV